MGALPPWNDAQWQEAFALSQLTHEFQHVNPTMDWPGSRASSGSSTCTGAGGTLGLAFLLPFQFFVATRRITVREMPRYLLMFVLGGCRVCSAGTWSRAGSSTCHASAPIG